MKIAVDISQSVYGTGVSIYTRFLLKNLLKIDSENEYVLYGGSLRKLSVLREISREICGKSDKCTYKLLPISPKVSDVLFNKMHFFTDRDFNR